MPLDTSIYQNVRGFEVPSILDSQIKGQNLSQLAMQQQRMANQMKDEDRERILMDQRRKLSAIGSAIEDVAGLPDHLQPEAYSKKREQLIQMGTIRPEEAPEQMDPSLIRGWYSAWKNSDEYRAKEKGLLGQQLTKSQIAKNYADAERDRAQAGKMMGLTEGQKAVDKDYAKSYNSLTQKGAVNAKTAIDRLESLASEIEKDTGLFESGGGRIASILPDAMRSRDAIRRRDQARNFANTTLKELFGGQLSDAEREAAAKEYYNDALGNADNAKIIRDKIAQLRDAYDTEIAKAKHYEQHGTLLGFRGVPQETAFASNGRTQAPDAGSGFEINEAHAKAPAVKPGSVEDGYVFMGGDPANPKSWKRTR